MYNDLNDQIKSAAMPPPPQPCSAVSMPSPITPMHPQQLQQHSCPTSSQFTSQQLQAHSSQWSQPKPSTSAYLGQDDYQPKYTCNLVLCYQYG